MGIYSKGHIINKTTSRDHYHTVICQLRGPPLISLIKAPSPIIADQSQPSLFDTCPVFKLSDMTLLVCPAPLLGRIRCYGWYIRIATVMEKSWNFGNFEIFWKSHGILTKNGHSHGNVMEFLNWSKKSWKKTHTL